VNTCSLHFSP